jgi:uncharacterized protein
LITYFSSLISCAQTFDASDYRKVSQPREHLALVYANRTPRAQLRVTTKGVTVTIYEWDGAKNLSNVAKHGLTFADAELVFAGPCVTFVDNRFAYGEERYITLGLLAGRLVLIAHASRGEVTRIISMRKANRREQGIYQKQLGAA